MRREARLNGNMELYRTLNHVRRRLIRYDRQELANKLAAVGEDFWNRNRPHDQGWIEEFAMGEAKFMASVEREPIVGVCVGSRGEAPG